METTTGAEIYRSLVEQWLGVARLAKDSYLAGVNAGFDVWERECRRLAAMPQSLGGVGAWASPTDGWVSMWPKPMEPETAAKFADVWSECARLQTELVQRTLGEGMRTWERLWPRFQI